MHTMNGILNAIRALEILEKRADECDSAWEQEPESLEAEAAFDEAYKAQWMQNELCAKMVHEFSNMAIDMKSAHMLISKKYRGQLCDLLKSAIN